MLDIVLDFETKSDLNINTRGAMNYLHTPNSDIVCLTYKILGPNNKTKLWFPGLDIPFKSLSNVRKIYAFNAEFDFMVWNILGTKLYNFPIWPLSKTVDVRAVCARYGLPMNLDMATRVMNVRTRKLKLSEGVMDRMTQPPFIHSSQDEREFFRYAIMDTDSLDELIHQLPTKELSPSEQEQWQLTAKLNFRGLPINVERCKRIYAVTRKYIEKKAEAISDLTNGAAERVTQTKRLKAWVIAQGYDMPNFKAETVDDMLKRNDLTDEVKTVLELRQEMGSSSIAKYKKMAMLEYRGRLHDVLVYHKAGPGRWAGEGAQLQNYPRATIKPKIHLITPEEAIEKFLDLTILDNVNVISPVFAAKALLRHMIEAPKGYVFGVLDYAGVEKNGLLWVAQDEPALAEIRRGVDQYKTMASQLYDIPYELIDDIQRAVGKVLILGCGYNLSGPGFKAYAAKQDIYLTDDQADQAVKVYREVYYLVKELWYRLKECAMSAIEYPGKKFTFKNCSYVVRMDHVGNNWLICTMPSGRDTYYFDPKVVEGKYGPVPSHMGIDSETHQWVRKELIPGRLTENIIQGICSDILRYHFKMLDSEGFLVSLLVHDEAICMFKEEEAEWRFARMIQIMETLPPWATGFPLKVEGKIVKTYRKI